MGTIQPTDQEAATQRSLAHLAEAFPAWRFAWLPTRELFLGERTGAAYRSAADAEPALLHARCAQVEKMLTPEMIAPGQESTTWAEDKRKKRGGGDG